jgi:hypothetical protein
VDKQEKKSKECCEIKDKEAQKNNITKSDGKENKSRRRKSQ